MEEIMNLNNPQARSILFDASQQSSNSMEGGLVPESERVPPLPLTKEEIMKLNNHSVTFEQARSMFDVDLPTFKAKLLEFNILVWNEPNGKQVRIHGDDYEIPIFINKIQHDYGVKGTATLSDVRKLIECDLYLTPGSYELTYKLPQASNYNLLKTDLDWHHAVEGSQARFVRLNLEAKDNKFVAAMKAGYDEYVNDISDDEYVDECDDAFDEQYADGYAAAYKDASDDDYDDEYAGEYAAAADKASASRLAILNLG